MILHLLSMMFQILMAYQSFYIIYKDWIKWQQFDISDMALFTGYNIYIPSIWPTPYDLCQIFEGVVQHQRVHFFMFRIERPVAQTSLSLMLYRVPRSGSFTLAKIS